MRLVDMVTTEFLWGRSLQANRGIFHAQYLAPVIRQRP